MIDQETSDFISKMNDSDLLSIFMNEIAYIKPEALEGKDGFAVYEANGTLLGYEKSFDAAILFIRQHELDPVRVH